MAADEQDQGELTRLALRTPEDDRAFEILVERTRDRLLRVARNLLADSAATEDVVQETYVRAYVALLERRFQEGGAGAGPWLRRILTRVSIDVLRARDRRRRRERLVAWLFGQPTTAPTTGADRRAELGSALDRLPVSQRTAVVLKDLEGWTAKEIAASLGCSEGAVEQRLVRGRATLRKELSDEPC